MKPRHDCSLPRQFMSRVGGASLASLAAWGLLGHPEATTARVASQRRDVEFTYVARLQGIPQEATELDLWMPLAKTTSEQEVIQREIISPVPYTIGEDPEYGNEILHVRLQPPFVEGLEMEVRYRARLLGVRATAAEAPPASEELQHALQPRGLVIIDDEVLARARRATAGRTTVADRARGIYDAVTQQVKYDKSVPGWGRGDTRRVCLLGTGNCTDFHSLFISMARASQVPSRFKIGVVIPQEASGTIPGYHCWAEFYDEGQGWVPVDASEAWKHPELADYYFGTRDPNRLLISLGRDIQLVPKSQNGPINIFFYPYVEVDGQAFEGVETAFRFRDLQPGGDA